MAVIVPKSLRLPNAFPSTLNPPPTIRHNRPPSQLRALDDKQDRDQEKKIATKEPDPDPRSASDDPTFDNRLAQVRLKYRSGTGKKAEQRRAKKSSGPGPGKKSVLLPPVRLREAVSDGLAVEVGFSPYSERLNGRLAGLGLAALLLVELGSGKGLLAYHAPPILFIQLYTVSAAAAILVKYEKERISVWPQKPSSSSSPTVAGE